MVTLIEKIEKSEATVSKLDTSWKNMKKDFLKDGAIDAGEEKKLKKISGKIKLVEAKVFDLRNQYETNKAEWLGESGKFEEFKVQAVELEEWGDPVAAALLSSASAIEEFEEIQQWKNATEALEKAVKKAKKPSDERTRQLLFKIDYEKLDTDIQEFYAELQISDFAAADDVRELFIKADDTILSADALAQVKTYDKACEEGKKLFAKLTAVEGAINQHQMHYETYTGIREIVAERLSSIGEREYQSEVTAGAVSNIEANLPAIDGAAELFNYVAALDLLDITLKILSEAEQDIAAHDPAEQPTHSVTLEDGTTLMFTKAEYEARVAALCKELKRGPLQRMKSAVEILADQWQHFYDMSDDQYVVAFFVETFAGTDLPNKSIVTKAQDAFNKCEGALSASDLDGFNKGCAGAEKAITDGMKKMKQYQEDIESAGETTIIVLEFTATASFTFCSVFAAPVVATVAGTGVIASAVIGGAAVAATHSSATEIGNWGAGGFDASWDGVKDSATNVLIDTGVGAVTGLISKGGSGGTHVVESIAAKIAPKVATETGFKLLSTAAVKKVTVVLVTEGCKQATDDAIKNVGALIKGDPKMTKEKFFDDLAVSWVKGAALAPLGHVIDKFAGKAYENLDPKDRAKIEDLVGKEVSSRLKDDIHIDTFNNLVKDRTDELVKKYVGDMIKKNSEKVIEKTVGEIKGQYSPTAIEKSIRESLFESPEYNEAIETTVKELVKEVEAAAPSST